jgi:hypothetical protein
MVGHVWSAFSRDAGYQYSGGLPIVSVSGVLRHLGVDTCELVTPYTPDAYGGSRPAAGSSWNATPCSSSPAWSARPARSSGTASAG